MAFLREEGFVVQESGGSGPDGGWDARVEMGDKHGIAHASKRKDWKRKLRQDAKKVKDLEDDRNEDYDLFVFVSSRGIQGDKQLEIEDEIEDEYGWKLILYHRDNILGELRQNKQRLATDYLDVDLEEKHDHLEEVKSLLDERLELIQNREEGASDLVGDPAVALHIIPNGVFSKDKVRASSEIPEPPVLGDLHPYTVTRGKSTFAHGRGGSENNHDSYAILRNDGLYESVTTKCIRRGVDDRLWIRGHIGQGGVALDAYVVLAAREATSALADLGFSGTAFVYLSFIDAGDVRLETAGLNKRGLYHEPPSIGTDLYTTEYGVLQIGSDEVIAGLEPVLSEVWRQLGEKDGTANIEDGKWARGSFTSNRETLIEEGQR